jgi:hypothetical protein
MENELCRPADALPALVWAARRQITSTALDALG